MVHAGSSDQPPYIVHRDLKPGKAMFESQCNAELLVGCASRENLVKGKAEKRARGIALQRKGCKGAVDRTCKDLAAAGGW